MRLLLFLTALFIGYLSSFAQSTYFFQLEEGASFKDSRRILSQDSLQSPIYSIQGKRSNLFLHPLYEFTFANDNDSGAIFRAGTGAQLNYLSKKVDLGLSYFYSNGEYMSYRSSLINDRSVLSASSHIHGRTQKEAHFWDAYLSYQPNQIFDFEIGYGRKFIGSGHRSLLLSDLSSPFPYLKIETKFWKLRYTNLFSQQQNSFGVVGDQELYQQKYTATHFLELKLFRKLSIGLFETVIWQADEGRYIRGIDPNYLNPVIFYRPVEFSTGSSDNVMIGANINYEFIPNYHLYFQLLLDEFLLAELRADVRQRIDESKDIRSGWWANKYGVQAGIKSMGFLGVEGLNVRIEYNAVRPYTYAHSSPTQAYTHNSLPLAHPLGANFEEGIAQLSYQKGKYHFQFQFNQSRRGLSPFGTNLGEEIELSNLSRSKEYENFIGQGISVNTRYFDASISRRFRILWGADWSLGYVWREQIAFDQVHGNQMIYFSIKTNVFRSTLDY